MKKTILISVSILLSIILISIVLYIGYGSTMINIENEKSIIKELSTDKENPIDILSTKKYGDDFLVLYTNPMDTKDNKYSYKFSHFVKHKLYKNRYKYIGGTTGNQTESMVSGIELNEAAEDGSITYAIANVASDETKCSVFEIDSEYGIPIRRVDVINVPKNNPYIIISNYKMKSKDNMLIVYDGEIELKWLTGEKSE